jgi:uncharacterized damage-inducible protein DinB
MQMSTTEFVHYWNSIRERTRRVVVLIPNDDLEWTYAPGRWTFGDLVRHLAGIERGMYAETALGRPSAYPGHDRSLAEGRDAVLRYLDDSHAESVAIFQSLTQEQWNGKCTTPAGTAITTWKWLRAMVEHEAHHRGQIYLMLGMRGIKTPQIFGLTEEEVRERSRPARD